MPDTLVGKVYSVVYTSEDFYILKFEAIGHRSVTAKGHLYGLIQISYDVPIKLVGKWVIDPKYGRQFAFQTWEPWSETTAGIAKFLNVCVEGFADFRLIDALVQKYGIETFSYLTDKRLEAQQQELGVSQEQLDHALLCWERMLAHRDLTLLLKAGGLNAAEIQMAVARFGSEASKIIVGNPFRLMEISGLSYAKVDKLAIHFGVDPKDPRRIQGAVLWALQEAAKQQGHLYLRRSELGALIGDLATREGMLPLPVGGDSSIDYNTAALELLRQKSVVLEPDAGLYLPTYYEYERKSADILASLLNNPGLTADLSTFLDAYEKSNRIQLSNAQREAVELLTKHRVVVITGLPGTGKTTVLRAIVRFLEEAKQSFALMAPTGIAAKRLSAVTGHVASTVHRALKFDGAEWGHHANNRYVIDSVVLDEASMMDQELFYRLLTALRPETRLVLVGDDAQLPSVGPGNVLRELIDCEKIPHVRLTEIFRQSVKGEIVTNSHKINSGKLPDLDVSNTNSEFRFVRLSDESRIVDLVVGMAQKLKSLNANFQILSPKYDGIVGVNKLNERLRDVLNPEGPKEWGRGDQRFREGDRLMVIQNDYELNVYNGDVGKLVRITRDAFVVKIHGVGDNAPNMEVYFPFAAAETKLRLAYAITAHKSQGSEFDTIIMPIVKSQGRMLQRNLLYTAVTRARKRVWLIGEEIAVQKAVENNKVIRRNTFLSRAIAASLAAGVSPSDAVQQADGSRSGGSVDGSAAKA